MRIEYTVGKTILEKDINGLKLELNCTDEEQIISEIKRLNSNKKAAHDISTERTIETLDKCAKLWLNREYSQKHIDALATITNQSPQLVAYELEGSMSMLLRENIEKEISEELGDSDVLDNWAETSYGYCHRQPRGLIFHNVSGNAFIVIPVSISMGLLSKNCNIVKVSGDEPYFAYAFYQSLCEIDSSIKDRLSVTYFDSSSSNIYETLVKESDCVVHWGGAYSGGIMAGLCAKHQTHLIMHGPKISFEVIDEEKDLEVVAQNIGSDIVFWEQKACLSPRIIFINKDIDRIFFASELAKSLENLSSVLPKAYLNPWNSVKTIQDRQYCLLKYGLKNETKVYSSKNADYTVVLNETLPDKEDIDRCFNRFIFVSPYESKEELYNYVEKNIKDYLQTMGYNGSDIEIIENMTQLGVSIVTKPGFMSRHYPGTSHDGMFNLQEMTYVVSRQL
ncbi:acyl-CoA reductase [Clostridium sp. CM028]|uniref:acyl-CoA reductase n=1 Tax=unclassified Clostridium TaxID=2614128 RepID=UPI001C0AF39B|nr:MULTISPECIES: acyl-CoA reductase [unclassified Clostridium]MBU3090805.1 acyl-CoA reductase [Clostridium sp. CF011]MBW9147844.1 acyl-CoA reductase [Clostridium sp. CM028]WAG69579.1 acyl-CoA reductase [Clostridium sp. CF011]WLC61284.1 acyl-CoA reductase [Clostridium sp. CM028]